MSEDFNTPSTEKAEFQKNDPKYFDDLKDFLDPLKRVNSSARTSILEMAQKYEETRDIAKIRTGGVSKEEDGKDPLKKYITLASAFLETDINNPRHFVVNFKGNHLAEYKIGASELLPPNVQFIRVKNEQEEVICEKAFRGINPDTHRVGYFDEEIFRATGKFVYVPVYSGFGIEVLDTQQLSDFDCQIRIREERENYFNPPQRPTRISRDNPPGKNISLLDERILDSQEASAARNKLLQLLPEYVNVPREEFRTPDVQGGNLACAKVVTTILREAGFMERIINDVEGTVEELTRLGWTISDDKAEPGDVIVWAPMIKPVKGSINDGGPEYAMGHEHIGIAIGPNTAVSNSSKDRMPRIGSIYTRRPVQYILKPPV